MISIRYDGPDYMFVKLYYKIRNWKWFYDPATRDMFIWLLVHANREEEYFHGVLIKRGQRATSYGHMAAELGFSIDQMRRAEKNLKSTGEITVKIYPKFQVITVVCFDKYQATPRQKPKHPPSNPQASPNNNESIENIKKEERIKSPADAGMPPAVASAELDQPADLSEWYAAHANDKWEDEE